MKIRNGFVSNSSSSSFIIGTNSNLKDSISKYINTIPTDVNFFGIDLHLLSKQIGETIENKCDITSIDEIEDDYDLDTQEKNKMSKYKTIYHGRLDSDGEILDCWLYEWIYPRGCKEYKIDTPDFFMYLMC